MGAKILVVDDERELVEMIKIRLETYGYDVVTALDGFEGLEKIKVHKPDLVVLDVNMPVMDGATMGSEMKSHPVLSKIPIIFLTCLINKKEAERKHHHVGGEVFLAKPFEYEELVETIQAMLNG